MYKSVYGAAGTLTGGVSAVANILQVSADLYSELNAVLGEGGSNHTYLILSDGLQVEVVKVTQLNGGNVSVVRAQDGTTGKVFAAGTIVTFALTSAAVTDIAAALIAAAGLPSGLTFAINSPNTVNQVGSVVTINVPKLPLVSPDGTVDVTTVGNGYGIDIERGAFGCCPEEG